MAVIEAPAQVEPDPAPLWLPWHGRIAVEQAEIRPPDSVEGLSMASQIATIMFGSRWKTFTRVAAAMAMVAFVAVLPTLSGGGWTSLLNTAFYQAWTLALLLAVTWRVRSVSIPTVAAFWLTGMFSTVLIVHFASGPLADLSGTGDRRAVWAIPALEEVAKALPLILAVIVGRKLWRHPGVSDLMILGFAVGGGYAFHQDGLWGRTSASGIRPNVGLLVPSFSQGDGVFIVGDAAWTAIVGLAIGLIVLHRGRAVCLVLAIFALLAVLGDHMLASDSHRTPDWVQNPAYGSKVLAILLIGGAIIATLLDRSRLDAIAARDHLFPADHRFLATNRRNEPDPFETMLVGRYRRFRNGVHTTVDATGSHWPPLSQARNAPVAELARFARAARIAVGPGSSPVGWARDPDSLGGERFVGPNGFTPYVAVDGEVSVSTPRSRPEAITAEPQDEDDDFLQVAIRVAFVLVLLAVLRLLAAGDQVAVDAAATLGAPQDALVMLRASLPDAPIAPPLIPTAIGGAYALLAAQGLNRTHPRNERDEEHDDDASADPDESED